MLAGLEALPYPRWEIAYLKEEDLQVHAAQGVEIVLAIPEDTLEEEGGRRSLQEGEAQRWDTPAEDLHDQPEAS